MRFAKWPSSDSMIMSSSFTARLRWATLRGAAPSHVRRADWLLQLNRPVRRVQELLPRAVALVGEADVDDGAALGLDRLGDQVQVRLLRGAAAFLDVALHAAADDVLPRALAALR